MSHDKPKPFTSTSLCPMSLGYLGMLLDDLLAVTGAASAVSSAMPLKNLRTPDCLAPIRSDSKHGCSERLRLAPAGSTLQFRAACCWLDTGGTCQRW